MARRKCRRRITHLSISKRTQKKTENFQWNREIKRRTRVAVLFPNKESGSGLVTGVIIEIHEEWITGRAYLDMDSLIGSRLEN